MSRSLVLIVDPDRSRRAALVKLLGRRTDVVEVANSEEALERTIQQAPHVVCVALRIGASGGLDVSRALRAMPLMEDAAFIVYGPDLAGRVWSVKARDQARRRAGVEHFLPGQARLEDVATVAWSEMKKRRQALAQTSPSRGGSALQVESARLSTAEVEAPVLGEVLKREASFDSLKMLLTTDVVAPTVDDITESQLDALSWSELLRARATLGNLKMAVRKFARSGFSSGKSRDGGSEEQDPTGP